MTNSIILTDQEWQEIEELALRRSVRDDLGRLALLRRATFRGVDTAPGMVFHFMARYQEFIKDVATPKRLFMEKNMKL